MVEIHEEEYETAEERDEIPHSDATRPLQPTPSQPPTDAKDDDMPPPPSDSEEEQVAEGVVKQTLEEGHGVEFPPPNATCFLHYRAWVVSDKSKFEDTWEEQPVEIVIGREKPEQKGLAKALARMKAGERALVKVTWENAYGHAGNFSFPHVPPQADVIYELLLIGFDTSTQGRARSQLTAEERIAAADRRKEAGNALYKEGNYLAASHHYEMVLAYMNDDFMMQMFGKYIQLADAVRLPALLNLAACELKLRHFGAAIEHCSQVIREDGSNVKALFRRGKARAELGQSEAAKDDLLKASKLAPKDASVLAELKRIRLAEREVRQKEREIFKGMFVKDEQKNRQQQQLWFVRVWFWLWMILQQFWPFSSFNRAKKED
eukprot:TRINITY_DN2252_c0_g1_i2.p1 TRINITY_DN2252_c0_g1~~TRINITY_DN2252_c0_g1_i2.p1  ORF type:complete len:377 (+),score=120.93 TRINITY_DN2252_c0_g1_i2:180-1310(+)